MNTSEKMIPQNITDEKITQNIHKFDIYALLWLLDSLGYKPEQILFKSNLSFTSSHALIQDIKFRLIPMKQVIITLNLGLLTSITPLPSYFIQAMETENLDEKAFLDFIEFFDHKLIQNYLKSIYPEFDPFLYPNWEKTKMDYLQLLDLKL